MGKFTPLDFNKYAALARQAAAEGCVLLKNENEALPLRKGDKVAVFGKKTETGVYRRCARYLAGGKQGL